MPGRRGAATAAALEQLGLEQEQVALWRKLFLPPVPSHVPHPIPVWTPDPRGGGRWVRRRRSTNLTSLIVDHFSGALALGGVYVTHTRALVIDLDNLSGKGAKLGRDVPLDSNLPIRRRLAELVAPKGLWIRSSASGGLHRWVFLDKPVPIDELALLAHARLKDCAERLSRELPAELLHEIRTRVRGGCRGVELLPRTTGNGHGDTIRAPLGPGSAVLRADGTRIIDRREGLATIAAFISTGGAVSLEQAFPGRVSTQLPLMPAATPPPPAPALSPVHRQALGMENRIRLLAARCDGRLPEGERAGPPDVREVAAYIRAKSCPPGTRHYSTCILIYDAILDGLTIDQARERLQRWLREVAPRTSRDARDRLDEALADTERLLRFYYRNGRPQPSGGARKPNPPGRLRRRDFSQLMTQLEGQRGRTVALAGRVLEHVRTNGLQIAGTDDYYCELPVRALGIRSRADYRDRAVLLSVGLLKPVRKALPRLDEHHPKGPRAAKPALWRVIWPFADSGPVLPPVANLFLGRHNSQLPPNQSHDPVLVAARSGGVGVWEEKEGVRPVGAVDAVASKGLVGAESPVCSSKGPLPQARQLPQDPKEEAGRPWWVSEAVGRGVRGEGHGEALESPGRFVECVGPRARRRNRSGPCGRRGRWVVVFGRFQSTTTRREAVVRARGPPKIR